MCVLTDIQDYKRIIKTIPRDMRVDTAQYYTNKNGSEYRLTYDTYRAQVLSMYQGLANLRTRTRERKKFAPMEKHIAKMVKAINWKWTDDLPNSGSFDIGIEWLSHVDGSVITRRAGGRFSKDVQIEANPTYLFAYKNSQALHKVRCPSFEQDCYAVPTRVIDQYTTDDGVKIIKAWGVYWYDDKKPEGMMFTAQKHGESVNHLTEKKAISLLNKRLKASVLERMGL